MRRALGIEPTAAWKPSQWKPYFDALRPDTKLIVIDPRRSESAERADLWLKLRPGTDGALAYGMLHVIINEGLWITNS